MGREAHRGPHVVGEDEKRCAEGPQAAERETVANRRHAVLANAEVQIAAAIVVCFQVFLAVE